MTKCRAPRTKRNASCPFPKVYAFSLIAYVVGFVIIAFSPTLTAYIVGSVLVAVGEAAISLLNTILCGDLVPLKYRGLAQGLLSTPYLATVWYTSSIAQALGTDKNWRWGYGMYCIIMPVVMGPAILVILYLERKARQQGLSLTAAEPIEDSTAQTPIVDDEEKKPDVPQQPKLSDLEVPRKTATKRLIEIWHELDSVGLILLGFGWSLLLLPFSLSAYANDGYRNPSLIAMFVVGGLCLVFYGFWEIFFAKFPTAPKRLFKNRTFITAIIIDFIYLMAGYMNLTYIYSYVWIVTDYDDRQQNSECTLTVAQPLSILPHISFFPALASLQQYPHSRPLLVRRCCWLVAQVHPSLQGNPAVRPMHQDYRICNGS